ncbi:MAG: hypothetical protein ACOX38_02450 [Bacillota bacterium]|nr:hypothetical protein [Bacillota bacterium]
MSLGKDASSGAAEANMLVQPDKRVFMVYVGLMASGYELASLEEGEPMARVAARAADVEWSPDLLAYYRWARVESREVNLYWPRAFLLVAAGLRI